VNNDI